MRKLKLWLYWQHPTVFAIACKLFGKRALP